MTDQEFIVDPVKIKVQFEILPVATLLNSIYILNQVEELGGLGEWVERTWAILPPERKLFNRMIPWMMEGFYKEPPAEEFPIFLEEARQVDANMARDSIVQGLAMKCSTYINNVDEEIDTDALMVDLDYLYDVFTRIIVAKHQQENMEIDVGIFDRLFDLLQEPRAMKAAVVDHLIYMWEKHLQIEWKQNLPILQETVTAFRQIELTAQSVIDAIKQVTGRDMSDKWPEKMMGKQAVTFVPSVHIGPYNAYFEHNDEVYIFFGARMPRGYKQPSPAPGRNELLVRLGALSDDTRLKILELLTQHHELCAQDIIEMLDLSQSSASRHLRQLAAASYLIERRREVAKCYSLNIERVDDTLQALEMFLKG